MRHLHASFALLLLLLGCRSTVKSTALMSLESTAMPPASFLALALGDGYSCVLNRKSQVLCQNARTANWQMLRAAGSPPALRSLVARASVACAIGVKPASLENRVLCWQPETGSDAILLSSKQGGRIQSLSLQKDKVCALLADGQVGCGPLAISTSALQFTPVPGLRAARSLSSGEGFSCAVRGDSGTIFCWGDNSQGQLGSSGPLRGASEATPVSDFASFATDVEAGAQHVCALNKPGEVFCWGANGDQQIGSEAQDLQKNARPQIVRGLPDRAVGLALGARHSCAQLSDGSVWCWGAAAAVGAESGGGLIPVRVNLSAPAVSLTAHGDRTCAVLRSSDVFCWGTEPQAWAVPRD